MSATVIIPTTGVPEVVDAVKSVLEQTYPTDCYVVIDGEEYMDQSVELLKQFDGNERFHITSLSVNVGAKGFYGHRVYAAFTHLINTDYVMWLDQDNWLSDRHVQNCVETIEARNLEWCYSLRQIRHKSGDFAAFDDCESLGKWQSYHGINHIDTNCYCVKTDVATKIASVWHGGWGQDRVFLATIAQHFQKFDCTNEYTVNYRVDGGRGSVTADFFENGNKIMNEKYNGVYPWRKKT